MKKHISLILAVIFIFLSISPAAYATVYVTDIKGHWAEKYINRLLLADIASGYNDKTFRPDNEINIDEFVTLVLKSKGEKTEIAPDEYWAADIIKSAETAGILNGIQKDDYSVPATREEMCVIIVNAFGITCEDDALGNFSDAGDVTAEYKKAVNAAVGSGVIKGYNDKEIGAIMHLTRAEACTAVENALAYEPEKTEFVDAEYKLNDMTNGGETPFSIYTAPRNNGNVSEYKLVSEKQDGTYSIFSEAGTVKRAAAYWKLDDIDNGVMIIPEKDESASGKRGDVIVCFTAPYSLNYEFDLSVKNIGTDVLGGGGSYSFTFAEAEDKLDAAIIKKGVIRQSSSSPVVSEEKTVVKLSKGEKVYLRFSVDVDGYANRFLASYSVKTTREEGQKYYNYGLKSYLPQPPLEQGISGEKFEKDRVYVAASYTWEQGDDKYLEESIGVLKKYIPNLGMIFVKHFPEQNCKAELFKSYGIPVMIQSFGNPTIYNYYTATDAWEYDWNGRGLFPGSGITLQNTGHAAAQPHESTKEVHERIITSAARSGYSGYGYMDFVWAYGLGSGHSGYNPQTIAQFRKDLKSEDEGLNIYVGGESRLWHFEDLAKYYIGAVLTPQDFGYDNWDDFEFLTYSEYQKNPDNDWTPYELMFDMLVHYEWLRCAQRYGRTAKDNGITGQILTNPEDMGNGNDMLLMSGIEDVGMYSEQYMGADCSDGSYYRLNYLTKNLDPNKSFGVVIEGGAGGNGGSYFDNELAYATCYEFCSNPRVTHLETDFWVQSQRTISESSEISKANKLRYQVLLSSAIAYNHAKEDNLERIEPDFVSVTSRREMRPWANAFKAWSWVLGWRGSPEIMLSKKGYNFESIGEEGIQDVGNQKCIVYSPEYATQYHFDKLLDMLSSGSVENVITNGVSVEKIVTYDYKFKNMEDVYPEYALMSENDKEISGKLTDASGNVIADNVTIKNVVYEKDGDEPVLFVNDIPIAVRKQVGKGSLYTVLFDPDDKENYDASADIYGYILNGIGLKNYWTTISDNTEYTDGRSARSAKDAFEGIESLGSHEKEASVRMYENDDLKMVSVSNPKGRHFCDAPDIPGGKVYPYKLSGNTEVRVRLEPSTEYAYAALPSGRRGSFETDEEGFCDLQLINTSHEMFYILPKNAENEARLTHIAARRLNLASALTAGGNIRAEDETAPATTAEINGVGADGKYTSAKITLSAADDEYGSGLKKLVYSVDGKEKSVVNRSVILKDKISETVELTSPGKHVIEFYAVDKAGNKEDIGSVEIEIA